MSTVGSNVGLGDRGENILFDAVCGDAVHVACLTKVVFETYFLST